MRDKQNNWIEKKKSSSSEIINRLHQLNILCIKWNVRGNTFLWTALNVSSYLR